MEYDGLDELEKGATFAIFGDSDVSFGTSFDTLVSNQANTLFWQLSNRGATFVGTENLVPEPASWILFSLFLGGWMSLRFRRRT